jgi:hypothetical protein
MATDILVYLPRRSWTCAGCGERDGGFLTLEEGQAFCLGCADLDGLVFLPRGDAAISRRARKASTLSAIVLEFSRSRQRYERQGLLVEPAALELAEEQCLSDDDARQRRRERDRERRAAQDVDFVAALTKEIRRLFPGCPLERAEAIAAHAGVRGSGRVGRSAAGRALEEGAVTAAVVASVRHEDTSYDELHMDGVPRLEARDRVRERIDQVLTAWR